MDIQYLLFLQNLRGATGGVFNEFFNALSKIAVDVMIFLPYLIFWCVDKVVCSVISIAVMSLYLSTKITWSHYVGIEFKFGCISILVLEIERDIDVLSDEVVGFDFRVPVVASSPLSRNSQFLVPGAIAGRPGLLDDSGYGLRCDGQQFVDGEIFDNLQFLLRLIAFEEFCVDVCCHVSLVV